MPFGFFTVEQWRGKKRGWTTVCHVTGYGKTLTEAMNQLESLGKPGFFRITQTQRMILAEKEMGKLRMRKWHVSTPEGLARTAEHFELEVGKRPRVSAKTDGRKRISARKRG
jgi:hypothetical protein